jgi:NAD(P)H-dependent FMN reductase
VVAPVLNLSGSEDFDPLKVTDLLASEALSFERVSVVPVNLALAELQRQGKCSVETPEDAVELARTLGADATLVTAVTEYNGYYPPVVGLTMQWYSAGGEPGRTGFDPVAASRATGSGGVELSDDGRLGPRWQVQRVFNAAHEQVLKEIRSFAAQRDADQSPYGWRKYVCCQELYVRYCGWAMIRTMLMLDGNDRLPVERDETES